LYKTQQDLRIEGIAEGEIQCEGTLTVAEGARVKATVTASTITIAGELEGEVVCQGVFQIMPSGQVDATVSARRLIVQEGGLYNGEFHMITDDKKVEKPSPASAAPARKDEALAAETEPPADDRPASDVVGSTEWWEKMTNPNPPATGSGDDPV
jgi:cytoskeletal protein CcmA (bactofilin family)